MILQPAVKLLQLLTRFAELAYMSPNTAANRLSLYFFVGLAVSDPPGIFRETIGTRQGKDFRTRGTVNTFRYTGLLQSARRAQKLQWLFPVFAIL